MDDLQTHPAIKRRITRCLNEVLHQKPISSIECTDYQEQIGWETFLFGFMSKRWAKQQHRYRTVLCLSSYSDKDPATWSAEIITFIWREMMQVWLTRCQAAHTQSEQHESLQQRLRAEATLTALYGLKDDIGPQDKDIFAMPLQERLENSSTADIISWTKIMEPAIKAARKTYQSQSHMHNHDIRKFFPIRRVPQRNHNVQDSISPQYRPP